MLTCIYTATHYQLLSIHITGTAGWGIAWYLNGLLIPNVTVFRGTTYTFKVEGGENPDNSARYHPFYISDNQRGGYLAKVEAARQVCKRQIAEYFILKKFCSKNFPAAC